MKKVIFTTTLVIGLLMNVPVANARDYHGRHHGDAFVAGLLGLGIGMAVAPRVYYYNDWDNDYYRRYPRYRQYHRHHYPRHYRYDDDSYDYRDYDQND